jgi:hypothetical protein
MVDIAPSITEAFDFLMSRLTRRVSGMSDEEYLWEPVAGCWSVRLDDDGRWTIDGARFGTTTFDPPRSRPSRGDSVISASH